MKTKKHYSTEVKERAVRLFNEQRSEYSSEWATLVSISSKIGCTAETLRSWVKRAQLNEIDNGQSEQDKLRIKQLEREEREIKRANEIIRMAAAFFAQAELDRKPQ